MAIDGLEPNRRTHTFRLPQAKLVSAAYGVAKPTSSAASRAIVPLAAGGGGAVWCARCGRYLYRLCNRQTIWKRFAKPETRRYGAGPVSFATGADHGVHSAGAGARERAAHRRRRWRDFNLIWHDWLNIDSLIHIGHTIALSALVREADLPQAEDPNVAPCPRARGATGELRLEFVPVHFIRVRPSETLLQAAA